MFLHLRDEDVHSWMGDFASALSEVSSKMDGLEWNYS